MLAFWTCKPGVMMGAFFGRVTLRDRTLNLPKKTSALGEAFLANSVGQQPVVANAHEPFWQAVQQEPTNELGGIQAHGSLAVAATVVFVTNGDLPVLQTNQPPVGYGHPMSIPGQILEHPLRRSKCRFRVDHPLGLAEPADKLIPVLGMPQRIKAPVILKLITVSQGLQLCYKPPPKQSAEHPHRQQESVFSRDPLPPVRGKSSGRDQAVHVGMVHQGLPPGVQDGGEPNFGAKMAGISGSGQQRSGSATKQQPVKLVFILQGKRTELMRKSEHDMEVPGIQQVFGLLIQPIGLPGCLAFRAVTVTAGVIGNQLMSALRALPAMSAKCGGSAGHQILYDYGLLQRARVAVQVVVGIAVQNIGHFHPTRAHGCPPAGMGRIAAASRSLGGAELVKGFPATCK